MPRRTAEHQVETESRLAFENAIGSQLLYRRLDLDDYGIDGEVEEFAESSGAATGLRFYVQLKATRQAAISKALQVSVPLDTANYYRSLPLPLLMVRYHAPSQQLYSRWFHQFDPYYGGVGQKGLTFKWSVSDVWDAKRPEALKADTRAFLALRSSFLNLPIRFHVTTPSSGALGLTATEILFAIRTAAAKRPDVLDVIRGMPTPGTASFAIRADELVVDLAGVTTTTLHYDESYDPGSTGQQLAIDAMVMAALAFEHVGQSDAAGRLASTFLGESAITSFPEVAWALSSAMTRTRQIEQALELSERLDQRLDPDTKEASFVFTLPALVHSDSLTAPEVEGLRRTLRSRISRREAAGDLAGAANNCVTLANQHRSRAEPRDAVRLYIRAARLDPEYRNRAHFWHELGGVLFGSQHYVASSEAYERALDLAGNGGAKALRADALMYAGRYDEARELFAEHNQTDSSVPEWRLKEIFLATLAETFGIHHQVRRPDEANALGGSVASETDAAMSEDELMRALSIDALSPVSWFNLGRAHLDLGKRGDAFFDYFAAAILYEGDPEAWVNAIALAFDDPDAMLLVPDMLSTASRFTGDRLTQQLVEFTRNQGDDFPREEFLAAIDDLLGDLPDERDRGISLRFLSEGGEVETITLRRPFDPIEQ
jgi:tetratricopeptide (TPR) repeat protein